MNETYAQRSGRRQPPWKATTLGILLTLDAVVTLLPQLYWAAGSGGRASIALLYSAGGSAFVGASIIAMYAIDSFGAARRDGQS